MVTAEEQSTYFAPKLNTMQTDVAELQKALQGSASRDADLMVQLFTSETRVRMVIEAGDEATGSGDEKYGCDDECCTEVQR